MTPSVERSIPRAAAMAASPRDGAPLVITASPHLKGRDTTARIMWTVVATLVPIAGASIYFFGPSALLVIVASMIGAFLVEHFLGKGGTLRDGSAAITGLLLALTLPPGIPMWMAALGGAFAIAFGKLIFGGLGFNAFNPALLGRAFLQAAFPTALTTWPKLGGSWWALRGDTFALPFMHPHETAVVTAATPLGLMKFEGKSTALGDLLLGTTGGSLGETAALLILVCGAYLALKRYLDWRIPVSVLGTVAVFAALLHLANAARYPSAAFMLLSGGLVLGAVYMATDPVTAPVTKPGRWAFGIGIGALVVVIRIWGGLPEGVMYAILLMNALVPFINRLTRPRVFGAARVQVTS
jgi:H+/Na+-translocating ferredoxin:NAD+ oxidoreductase subunit D